jgi:hypothetical protein
MFEPLLLFVLSGELKDMVLSLSLSVSLDEERSRLL